MATGVNNNIAALSGTLAQGMQQLQAMGLNITGGGGTAAAAPAAAAAPGTGTTPTSNEPKSKVPATGKPQALVVNGVTKFYDAGVDPATGQMRADKMAHEITAYQYTMTHTYKVNLDVKPGLSTGLSNLAKIFGARQERVSALSNALAMDANTTGSFNAQDMQMMMMESQTTAQLSEMQKKIYDNMQQASQIWLR